MQNTFSHLITKQQPGLGMPAYWSVFATSNDNGRTSEIRVGFQEGDGYA